MSRIASKYGLTWKRIRRSLKSKRNVEQFKQAEEDIKAFERLAAKGECEVVFFDAFSDDLTPSVRSVWQPASRENTIEVPSFKSQRINVIGFLNADDNELTPFVFIGGSISSAEIIACFESFIKDKAKESLAAKQVDDKKVVKNTIPNEGEVVFDKNNKPTTPIIDVTLDSTGPVPVIIFDATLLETTVNQSFSVVNEDISLQTTVNQSFPDEYEEAPLQTTVNQSKPVVNEEVPLQTTVSQPFPDEYDEAPLQTTVNQSKPVVNEEVPLQTTVSQPFPVVNEEAPLQTTINQSFAPLQTAVNQSFPVAIEEAYLQKTANQSFPDVETIIKKVMDSTEPVEKPIVVVMDNASVHTSSAFENSIESFQSRGLFPYFLPPVSKELNKIEILWQKIKYQWLPLEAYQSFKKLTKAINNILIQYGSQYQINFA